MSGRFCARVGDRHPASIVQDFPYWLKRASGAARSAPAGPRAPGMRRWRAGPCAHPTGYARKCRRAPAAGRRSPTTARPRLAAETPLTLEPPTRSLIVCTTPPGINGARVAPR